MFRKRPGFDPFNTRNRRNIFNTNKRAYNCAGYALETFSWYCPHSEEDEESNLWGYDYSFETTREAMAKTAYSVRKMIQDFQGKLREVTSLEQVDKKTERVVAFRLSSDGDFHYIKRSSNNHWYHKMGASCYINTMTEWEVFHSIWCGRYDGPIVLLAIKK